MRKSNAVVRAYITVAIGVVMICLLGWHIFRPNELFARTRRVIREYEAAVSYYLYASATSGVERIFYIRDPLMANRLVTKRLIESHYLYGYRIDKSGVLLDEWLQPFRMLYVTNPIGKCVFSDYQTEVYLLMWSAGVNGIDEHGRNDDVCNWHKDRLTDRILVQMLTNEFQQVK